MKRVLKPTDFACSFTKCPLGLFIFEDILCFKSEDQAYCEDGRSFWGGTESCAERDRLIVQPVEMIVEEE